jgi:glycine cleavage system regulatory protein
VTVIGDDRPGLVESLAAAIASEQGNWLESRLVHLAGKFAGVVRVAVPPGASDGLRGALRDLGRLGLTVVAEPGASVGIAFREVRLELVGADHPGIVRDVSTALARRRVNVEELETGCFDAAMSGQTLFRATARLQLPADLSLPELRAELEALAQDLVVDVTLAEVDA